MLAVMALDFISTGMILVDKQIGTGIEFDRPQYFHQKYVLHLKLFRMHFYFQEFAIFEDKITVIHFRSGSASILIIF